MRIMCVLSSCWVGEGKWRRVGGAKEKTVLSFPRQRLGSRCGENGGDIHKSSRSITTVKRKHRKAKFSGKKTIMTFYPSLSSQSQDFYNFDPPTFTFSSSTTAANIPSATSSPSSASVTHVTTPAR